MESVTSAASADAPAGGAAPRTGQVDVEDVVRSALGSVYAHPVLRAQADGRVAVLAGRPLELARAAVATAVEAAGETADATGAAAALVVELDPATQPWMSVPAAGLQLWRQHGRAGSDGELVTQLEAGDPPVQLVVRDGSWQLVRLLDGAQGWVTGPVLEAADAPDVARASDTSRVHPEAFVAAALDFEGAPYVWGGTSAAGVDCSGIVQRAAWRAGGVWLPRHSRALLGAGERVAPSAVRRGDVLVLRRERATYAAEERAQQEHQQRTGAVPSHGPAIHPMHVAIALSPDEVLHASRDAMRVVREPLGQLRERYRVLGVRRLGAGGAA